MLPSIAIEGRLAADPELRYSPTGVAVGKFDIIANGRKLVKNDQGQDEWVDDKVLFLRVTSFKRLAENVVESLRKGDLVVVTGKLQTDQWTTETNEKRSMTVCLADTVAKSLALVAIPVGAGQAERTSSQTVDSDPWASPAPATQSDEPPF